MKWEIHFYSKKEMEIVKKFPKSILANLVRIFEMIEELGPNLGLPYTKSIGKGLFEIRSKGREGIGRSLFCIVKDNKIIILHSFIKKSNKIPKNDLDIARKRMKEILNENN